MRPLLAGAGLLFLACGPAPLRFSVHTHGGGDHLAYEGRPTRVLAYVTTPGGDYRVNVMPDDPQCEVAAPSGTSTPCSVSLAGASMDEDNGSIVVTFTPLEEGRHDVAILLREGGGLTQHVTAVPLHATEVAELPLRCDGLAQLSDEAWLCDDRVLRRGQQTQRLWAERVAAGGAAVWSVNSGELRRYRDTGAGLLVAEPTAALDVGVFDVATLLAREDDAVVVHGGGLIHVQYAAGALRVAVQIAFAVPGRVVAVRSGDTVLTARPANPGTEVCAWPLAPPSVATCRTWPAYALGSGGGGLWLASVEGGTVTMRFVGAALDEGLVGTLPSTGAQLDYQAPAVGMRCLPYGIVPRVLDGAVRFEAFEVGTTTATWATDALAWGAQVQTAVSTTTHVLLR